MLKHQRGLSLIELMVALTVSSFLVIGIVQIFIDNKNSFLFHQAQTENQENSRYTFLILDQELSKAGYRRQPDRNFATVFPTVGTSGGAPAGCSFSQGQSVALASTGGICIRYEPRDREERNCAGAKPAATEVPAQPYTSTTLMVMEKFHLDTNGDLLCTVGSADPQVVLSGIADLQFEYGVGPASDERQVASYVTTPGTLPIRAVRYSALMASSSNVRQGMSSLTLQQWKTRYPGSTPNTNASFDSGQLFQVAQGSITFRNLMP
ncbi:hypothetical protein D9M68_600580 [compost metagenome]